MINLIRNSVRTPQDEIKDQLNPTVSLARSLKTFESSIRMRQLFTITDFTLYFDEKKKEGTPYVITVNGVSVDLTLKNAINEEIAFSTVALYKMMRYEKPLSMSIWEFLNTKSKPFDCIVESDCIKFIKRQTPLKDAPEDNIVNTLDLSVDIVEIDQYGKRRELPLNITMLAIDGEQIVTTPEERIDQFSLVRQVLTTNFKEGNEKLILKETDEIVDDVRKTSSYLTEPDRFSIKILLFDGWYYLPNMPGCGGCDKDCLKFLGELDSNEEMLSRTNVFNFAEDNDFCMMPNVYRSKSTKIGFEIRNIERLTNLDKIDIRLVQLLKYCTCNGNCFRIISKIDFLDELMRLYWLFVKHDFNPEWLYIADVQLEWFEMSSLNLSNDDDHFQKKQKNRRRYFDKTISHAINMLSSWSYIFSSLEYSSDSVRWLESHWDQDIENMIFDDQNIVPPLLKFVSNGVYRIVEFTSMSPKDTFGEEEKHEMIIFKSSFNNPEKVSLTFSELIKMINDNEILADHILERLTVETSDTTEKCVEVDSLLYSKPNILNYRAPDYMTRYSTSKQIKEKLIYMKNREGFCFFNICVLCKEQNRIAHKRICFIMHITQKCNTLYACVCKLPNGMTETSNTMTLRNFQVVSSKTKISNILMRNLAPTIYIVNRFVEKMMEDDEVAIYGDVLEISPLSCVNLNSVDMINLEKRTTKLLPKSGETQKNERHWFNRREVTEHMSLVEIMHTETNIEKKLIMLSQILKTEGRNKYFWTEFEKHKAEYMELSLLIASRTQKVSEIEIEQAQNEIRELKAINEIRQIGINKESLKHNIADSKSYNDTDTENNNNNEFSSFTKDNNQDETEEKYKASSISNQETHSTNGNIDSLLKIEEQYKTDREKMSDLMSKVLITDKLIFNLGLQGKPYLEEFKNKQNLLKTLSECNEGYFNNLHSDIKNVLINLSIENLQLKLKNATSVFEMVDLLNKLAILKMEVGLPNEMEYKTMLYLYKIGDEGKSAIVKLTGTYEISWRQYDVDEYDSKRAQFLIVNLFEKCRQCLPESMEHFNLNEACGLVDIITFGDKPGHPSRSKQIAQIGDAFLTLHVVLTSLKDVHVDANNVQTMRSLYTSNEFLSHKFDFIFDKNMEEANKMFPVLNGQLNKKYKATIIEGIIGFLIVFYGTFSAGIFITSFIIDPKNR